MTEILVDGQYLPTYWSNVKVGDVIRNKNDDFIPVGRVCFFFENLFDILRLI
jgi:hypothetical protein